MTIKNTNRRSATKFVGIVVLLSIVIVALAALAVYMYAGTGGLGAPNTVGPEPTLSQEQQMAPPKGVDKEIVMKDLTGKWMGHIKETAFIVEIKDSTVTVRMAKNGSSMLYWYGKFLNTATVGDVITSHKLDINKAVLSSADSKDFAVNQDTLTFDVSAMGQTTTVEVTHASA